MEVENLIAVDPFDCEVECLRQSKAKVSRVHLRRLLSNCAFVNEAGKAVIQFVPREMKSDLDAEF